MALPSRRQAQVELDQQRDRRVERLGAVERPAFLAGRNGSAGVDEVIEVEVGHGTAVLQQAGAGLLAEAAVVGAWGLRLDAGDAVLARAIDEAAVLPVGADQLVAAKDAQCERLQIDVEPQDASIDAQPLRRVLDDACRNPSQPPIDHGEGTVGGDVRIGPRVELHAQTGGRQHR
ncbi:MAG: hypothetical protein U1E38_05705 [Rhodospirillales bacterium]